MADRETVSDVLLETLQAAGIRYLFANLGTDYAPIVESLAKHAAEGSALPEMVLCPHENTAITAAHGYALATGRGQGVLVHVGVGTQNLGGALHNAWAGRIPLFIFAGRSPQSTRGERPGGRDTWIHYYQDVRDQAGIIRQYCKWEFNLELPEQSAYAVQRAVRLMQSEPPGAVYMTAGREILAMPIAEMRSDPPERAVPAALGDLPEAAAKRLAEALWAAERPLIVTTYLGRNAAAVETLVALSETVGVPVLESAASHLSFPRDHANHWGFRPGKAIVEADFVLLLDTDVPWLAKAGAPPQTTPVVQLDVDPLKASIVLWDFPVTESHGVDTAIALPKVLAHARRLSATQLGPREARQDWLARHRPAEPAPAPKADAAALTVASLGALLSEGLGPDAVFFDETISNADLTRVVTRRTRPGTYFGSPGGSLGWGGGAALGYKLAVPQAEVAWLVGDGSFYFSVPSSLYNVAQRYGVPFLTVIYNNDGWAAVKNATVRVYGKDGQAARSGDYQHRLGDGGALELVAAAFGAYAAAVDSAGAFRAALREARAAMAQGRAAVIHARLRDDP